jgi:hypothetical protein
MGREEGRRRTSNFQHSTSNVERGRGVAEPRVNLKRLFDRGGAKSAEKKADLAAKERKDRKDGER